MYRYSHDSTIIDAHIHTHGHICPGWNRPPHPADDLCVDLDGIGVMCEACTRAEHQPEPAT